MAKESGIEGVFILISKKEKKIQVLVSHRFLGETMKRQRDVIRTAFVQGFRHGDLDGGLELRRRGDRGIAAPGPPRRRDFCTGGFSGGCSVRQRG